MYSPKIPEHLIPILYRLGQARGRPMTHLVAEAVEQYLSTEGHLTATARLDADGGCEADDYDRAA